MGRCRAFHQAGAYAHSVIPAQTTEDLKVASAVSAFLRLGVTATPLILQFCEVFPAETRGFLEFGIPNTGCSYAAEFFLSMKYVVDNFLWS